MNQGRWSDEAVNERRLANLAKAQEALKQKRAKSGIGANNFSIVPITTEEVKQVNESAEEHESPRAFEPVHEERGMLKHLATSILSSVTTAAVSYLTLYMVGAVRNYLSRAPNASYSDGNSNFNRTEEPTITYAQGKLRYTYDTKRDPYLRDYSDF
jgi:hypothetical protein